jgi:general nucleoside transport system ATP-binding protein
MATGEGDTAALELSHVTKRFGALLALDDVSLAVRPGTVHAVLGENGAGKTTLMHIAYGLTRADSGAVGVGGRALAMRTPLDAIRAGLGMVHQHFTLVPAMTVAENIALGGTGRLRSAAVATKVRELTRRTGFTLDPTARVEALPVGAQQRVEIAKALAHGATLLILDEPTAVLAPAEVDDLLRWLRGFVRDGNAAVLITHKLREALAVADDVTVLRRGRVVHSGPAAGLTPSALTTAMIGSGTDTADTMAPTATAGTDAPVFVAEHVVLGAGKRNVIHDATFTIHRGEIVGVAAVEGSGQHALLRALAGRYPVSSGALRRPNVVGFVPEDRHRDAVLLDRSLTENVALRDAGSRSGVMNWSAARERTQALMRAFDVRAEHPATSMRTLSGGNQQKLVLARELTPGDDSVASTALVVENPTRGLDVRATADVHRRLRDAAAAGAAVVMYSSDLDEVLALASRVLVVFNGRVHELPMDREAIGQAMLGH